MAPNSSGAELTGSKSDYSRTAKSNPLPRCLGGSSVPSEKERYLRKDWAQFHLILLETMKTSSGVQRSLCRGTLCLCQMWKSSFWEVGNIIFSSWFLSKGPIKIFLTFCTMENLVLLFSGTKYEHSSPWPAFSKTIKWVRKYKAFSMKDCFL